MKGKYTEIFPPEYILPFLVYVFMTMLESALTGFRDTVIVVKFIVVGAVVLYYRKDYKIKLKLSSGPFFWGLLIFILWVALSEFFASSNVSSYEPSSVYVIIFKLLTGVILAPLIEEFFTRSYLIRVLIRENWRKVPIGQFTWFSFIVTVLFFGFSHDMKLSGLVSGLILNAVLYWYRRVDECVMSHAWANLLLGIFVIINGEWFYW